MSNGDGPGKIDLPGLKIIVRSRIGYQRWERAFESPFRPVGELAREIDPDSLAVTIEVGQAERPFYSFFRQARLWEKLRHRDQTATAHPLTSVYHYAFDHRSERVAILFDSQESVGERYHIAGFDLYELEIKLPSEKTGGCGQVVLRLVGSARARQSQEGGVTVVLPDDDHSLDEYCGVITAHYLHLWGLPK